MQAKSLKTLSNVYDNKEHLRFLKQYITINRSELFFADKAILIEGDTERILLPAIIKKLDIINPAIKPELPLLSQNVSIIEVGAHAEIFVKLLNFLGLAKVLVLTDFDSCSPDGNHAKENYESGKNQITSNTAIKFFFNEEISDVLAAKTDNDKHFVWDDASSKMVVNNNGLYMVCYQTAESGYQPRSFEDDFIALNKQFILDNSFSKRAIKADYKDGLDSLEKAFDVADKVESKAAFAFDILLNSKDDGNDPFGGWSIPSYIKDGLLWLRK